VSKSPRRVRVLMMPYQDDEDKNPVGYPIFFPTAIPAALLSFAPVSRLIGFSL
jgi:hypothetical protein